MKKLAILGLGHVGQYVFDTLSKDQNFQVTGYDARLGHDLADPNVIHGIVNSADGVLASTPFFLNEKIAQACNAQGRDYFDLTESVSVTNVVRQFTNARFVTQCGLAPGIVSIIANQLAGIFEQVQDIHIRVGALPVSANNHLGYYRTWNTEGLINEYIHPCPALQSGQLVNLEPLSLLEPVRLNGLDLEAATTSGGLGSLAETWQGRARNVNYKTLRYPGHWKLMQFLRDDLGLAENFESFVNLFNQSLPQTHQDLVFILITVTGLNAGHLHTRQYSKIVTYDDSITAIQRTTGSGIMSVLDAWAQGKLDNQMGWIRQEDLNFDSIWNSQYAECYR